MFTDWSSSRVDDFRRHEVVINILGPTGSAKTQKAYDDRFVLEG